MSLPKVIDAAAEQKETSSIGELFSLHARLGRLGGLERLGINIETLPPGTKSSDAHCHSHEEEAVYIIRGSGTLWLNGHTQTIRQGQFVAFPPGTGDSHCILNDSQEDLVMLVVGEDLPDKDMCYYPVNPDRNERVKGHPAFNDEENVAFWKKASGMPQGLESASCKNPRKQ